jgi:hypothetical protein
VSPAACCKQQLPAASMTWWCVGITFASEALKRCSCRDTNFYPKLLRQALLLAPAPSSALFCAEPAP